MFQIGDIVVDPMTNGFDNGYGITGGKEFKGEVTRVYDSQVIEVKVLDCRDKTYLGMKYDIKPEYVVKEIEQIIKLK